ncbi:antitoxin [Ornithinimicrobium murale]|uniref:antitoxin n=1 Tax=Ornithinimicrobium murale TaxID=1050153 RepID=UPI0013B4529E|nr:antitoxin [Ornithinimicrobium murale]
MALKDMLAKARAAATGAVTQHHAKIDQGITKIGEVANTKTAGRYEDQIAKGSHHARAGLDKIRSDRPDSARPNTDGLDTDGPAPGTPDPR